MTDNAPAPGPAFVSDTTGMTESQSQAMRFVDETRAELAADLNNLALKVRHTEALDHVFRGGPAPKWLTPKTAEQIAAEAQPVDQDSIPGMAAAFEPMSEADSDHVRHTAVLHGVPPADADALTKFCRDAQIPATHAKGIAERVAKHIKGGHGTMLTAEESAEFYDAAIHSFGTAGRFEATRAKARAYIESLPPNVAQFVDQRIAGTSLAYDPRILIALAALADARGVTVK
jgi:hypothetical protein